MYLSRDSAKFWVRGQFGVSVNRNDARFYPESHLYPQPDRERDNCPLARLRLTGKKGSPFLFPRDDTGRTMQFRQLSAIKVVSLIVISTTSACPRGAHNPTSTHVFLALVQEQEVVETRVGPPDACLFLSTSRKGSLLRSWTAGCCYRRLRRDRVVSRCIFLWPLRSLLARHHP